MLRAIPTIVDDSVPLDLSKRYWKLALYNPDGTPYTPNMGAGSGGLTADEMDAALGTKLEAALTALEG